MATVFIDIPVPAMPGAGAPVDVSALGVPRTVTLSGVGFESIVVEGSQDGATWAPLVTFQANGGKRSISASTAWLRAVVVTAAGGVTANCDVGAGNSGTVTAALAVPAGNGAGIAVDISALPLTKSVIVGGPFTGQLVVQISEDGVDWRDCFSFAGIGGIASKNFFAQFARVVRANVTGGAAPSVGVSGSNTPATGGGGPPTGPAGGDLSGTYPSPVIARPRATFTFRPGGVAGANVYTDWTALMAALSATDGIRYLEFDSTIAGTCVIPAGGPYPMQDVRWVTPPGTTGATNKITNIDIADGASFTNLRWIDGDFSIRNLNTVTPADSTLAPGDIIRILGGGTLSNNGAAPLWRATGLNTFLAVVLVEFCTVIGTVGTVFDLPTAGGILVVQLGFGATWRGSAVSGIAGTTMSIAKRSSSASFATVYAAFAGTISTTSSAWDATPAWRLDPFLLAPRTSAITSPGDGEIMRFNVAGGPVTQTLPSINARAASVLDAGGALLIKETSGTDGLSYRPAAGDTIDGSGATRALPAGGAAMLVQDGLSNWHIIHEWAPFGANAPLSFRDMDPTAGPVATVLPAAPQLRERIVISDVAGTCSVVNTITVNGNGNNIDGAATAVLTVAYASITVVWTGTIWKII